MGVIGATKHFFDKYGLKRINLRYSQNKIVIIDAFSIVYRFCIGYINAGKQMVDNKGNNTMEQYCLLVLALKFLHLNITPVFVFDGKPPEEKHFKLHQRTNNKKKAEEKLDICQDTYIKYLKRSYSIDTKSFERGKFILRTMGIPVINAIGEAEQQCAAITTEYKQKILGVITDDTDILLFGSNMLRVENFKSDILTSYTLENVYITIQQQINNVINMNEELKQKYIDIPKITHKNIIDIGCLMGTDYCNGIRIKEHKILLETYVKNNMSFDETIDSIKLLTPSHIERIKTARNMYDKTNIIQPKQINIYMNEPCIELFILQCNTFINDNIIKTIANELMLIYYNKKNNRLFNNNTFLMPEPLYYKKMKL